MIILRWSRVVLNIILVKGTAIFRQCHLTARSTVVVSQHRWMQSFGGGQLKILNAHKVCHFDF